MAVGKQMEAIISLVGKVDPSLSKAIASVEKKLSVMKKLDKVGQTVGKVGQTVGKAGVAAANGIAVAAGAASTALAAIGTAAVTSYADYEQMIGGVEALFGEQAAKTVAENAANAFKTAGVSANSYMEQATSFSASLIQNLGNDTQKAAQYADLAIKDMSDNSNRMGTSIESIQQTYQSLMRGNYAINELPLAA